MCPVSIPTVLFFIAYANIKPTGISADNLELSMHVTGSSNRPGIRCSQADILIYGERDMDDIVIIKPECVAWTLYKFSENAENGDKHDLRAIGYDLQTGADVKLRIGNKKVTLMINSKEVFKTEYKLPIGKLMGVKVRISGTGYFENLTITDLKTDEKF